MPQPVAVAVVLRKYGLSLPRAHAALNKLAETKIAITEMPETLDFDAIDAELGRLGVVARRRARPQSGGPAHLFAGWARNRRRRRRP